MESARIMIVEDNTVVAEDCRDSLERLGYRVPSVMASGEEAIAEAEKELPDAVLMDIHLRDEMSGIEVAEIIYARFGIPVLFLSAYSDPELLERAKKVGSFGYLLKPFNEHELVATLEMMLYKAKAEQKGKRIDLRLRQAQKLESLGVLAGGIAHDFNNLLTAIQGNAELALSALSPCAQVRKNIQAIEKASKCAAKLTRQMLAYSGKGHFFIQPIYLNQFIEEMTTLFKVSISKKIVLNYDFAETIPPFEGDSTQINQLIMNLITNASEAIGDQCGVIALSAGVMDCDSAKLQNTWSPEDLPEGKYVYIEVADSGGGMDKETLEKIFDPFFSTKFPGRGLGLSAVLGIVRGHKGTIKVTSKVGKGTIFKVLFPVAVPIEHPAPAPAKQPGSESHQAPDFSGTILLADDEEVVSTLGKDMLTHLGFNVLLASNGREAVEMYRQHADQITLVLLDLTMPYMDGEEVFRELRRICTNVKVILCSGYTEQTATGRFKGKELAGFLQKPYSMALLKEKLIDALASEEEGRN